MMERSIWVGFDPREAAAFSVAKFSIRKHLSQRIPVHGLVLSDLIERGLYQRPMRWKKVPPHLGHVMWDEVSGAPMSTQHANARFFVPMMAWNGWALFVDGDILFRGDLVKLFDSLENKYAVQCVKHNYKPDKDTKMDGQIQSQYNRKNWSSVVAFNCDHPANQKLTLDLLNTTPGRDLHSFCWLEDDQIGALDPRWNYLVGHSKDKDPLAVHFTEGVPSMEGYKEVEYADEWRKSLDQWARNS